MEDLKLDDGQIIDTFTACSVVEGFCAFEPTTEDHIKSWAFLIKTGACWSLQGWYGRAASKYIEAGYISKEGVINWDLVYETINN